MCLCFEVLGFDILLDDKLVVEDCLLGFAKPRSALNRTPGIGVSSGGGT